MNKRKQRGPGRAHRPAKWLRLCGAAGMAFWTAVSAQALTIDETVAANVTPFQFDVFIRTLEPADTWLEVYSDAAGTVPLAGEVGIERSPVHTGDSATTNAYFRRLGVRAIQAGARAKSLALIRVSGCEPDTTYYYRVRATNSTASVQWPAGGGLMAVTTEHGNEFIIESRQLLLDMDPTVLPPSTTGAIGLLETAGASYPVAAFVGDGTKENQIWFDLSGLFSAATRENLVLSNAADCAVTLYGSPGQPNLLAEFSIDFLNAAEVAMADVGSLVGKLVLEIRSVAGQAVPPVGFYTNAWGTEIACTLTNTFVGSATVQHASSGWVLTGSSPGSGTNTAVSVVLTNNAVLTWTWKTRYWLDTGAGEFGLVDEPDQWVDAGEVVAITALPDVFYHVDRWSGDLLNTVESGGQLLVPMTQPRSIMAWFAENLTGNGVPQRWLYEQGFTNEWEAASLMDQDGDGMLTWAEYVAGTSPTNAQDRLAVQIEYTRWDDTTTLVWPSVSNRVYKVWRSDDLTQGFRQVSGNLKASPPANTFREPAMPSGQPLFYRISVEKK